MIASRFVILTLYFLGIFLQAGTYGLTFMLPKLFADFGADEKDVGRMLMVTAIATLISVYYSGHLSDRLGRMATLGLSGFAIALALFLFGWAKALGPMLVLASALLGIGWSLFYALGPVVLTRITEPGERVRYFSLLSIFVMAGFGLSPVMAAVLENIGLDISDAFFIMSAVCLFSGTLFWTLTTPIRELSLAKEEEPRSSLTLATVGRVFRSRGLVPVIMVCLGASIFAGMSNFQTVFAEAQGLNYADFFLAYTITVVICRIFLTGFSGGKAPYAVIAALQSVMCASILFFMVVDGNQPLYILVAILFGIGYGASYPILVAMAANDADDDLIPQTLQLFALTYFIGIFGFPLVAGWLIVEQGTLSLLILIAILAAIEATMAAKRFFSNKMMQS
ncbi:MAG: MFS transporter [Geminicoccales bacterium]